MEQESRIQMLLAKMTLEEKIGQMWQINGQNEGNETLVREGRAGSALNLTDWRKQVNPAAVYNRFQRIAMEESRMGIPLIVGRDVIHGFRTILPIPLGQAASFDDALVEAGAALAAREARAYGINWTFAPMVDISRDSRWGRIAESPGEDPVLASRMGTAMARGFQREGIAACGKHYAGYGAAEAGRDYNTTTIPEGLLRDVYLAPFEALVKDGCMTFMSAFNEINGVPATGNEMLIRRILKGEFGFDGFVVSDWASVQEMVMHGYCETPAAAALAALRAGVDMEMVTECYVENFKTLVRTGQIEQVWIDDAVARILRIKLRLGLFDAPYLPEDRMGIALCDEHRALARRAAIESTVLLRNTDRTLPLTAAVKTLAVIGPLADAPADQLGCWVMDGDVDACVTPLMALRTVMSARGGVVHYVQALVNSRDTSTEHFSAACAAAAASDAVVLVMGEEATLSGEAHCRAYLHLPGAQQSLFKALVETGKPVVAVVMAGRPLVLGAVAQHAAAILWVWHPGTQGGESIADLLFGEAVPSGKLPVSFPRTEGQIPVYYNHKMTGRPPVADARLGVPEGTPLDPRNFTTSYLDCDFRPAFPFGFGLSYTTFSYGDLCVETPTVSLGKEVTVSASITNTGDVEADEIVQLYVRDLVASCTRPVRELKDYRRITLKSGETARVTFTLHTEALGFHDPKMNRVVEPGDFDVWIAGASDSGLQGRFAVV